MAPTISTREVNEQLHRSIKEKMKKKFTKNPPQPNLTETPHQGRPNDREEDIHEALKDVLYENKLLQIEVRRLRKLLHQNGVIDPIGDGGELVMEETQEANAKQRKPKLSHLDGHSSHSGQAEGAGEEVEVKEEEAESPVDADSDNNVVVISDDYSDENELVPNENRAGPLSNSYKLPTPDEYGSYKSLWVGKKNVNDKVCCVLSLGLGPNDLYSMASERKVEIYGRRVGWNPGQVEAALEVRLRVQRSVNTANFRAGRVKSNRGDGLGKCKRGPQKGHGTGLIEE